MEKLVIDDRRNKVNEIAMAMSISTGNMQIMLYDNIGWLTVFARWVPKVFSGPQVIDRVDMFRAKLNVFSSNSEDFCLCVVTEDERGFITMIRKSSS